MEKVGSVHVGVDVDSSQVDELIAKLDEALGKAEALRGAMRFPTDADGIPIRPGDDIHLSHNNKDRHVNCMTVYEDGTWLVHCTSGGGFGMPESKEYVTHVKSDEERMFEANVAKNNEIMRLLRENAKLRDLVRYMHRCYVMGHDWGPYGAPEKEHVEDSMRDLGMDVHASRLKKADWE